MKFEIYYRTSLGGFRTYNEVEAPDEKTALAINFECAKKQIPEDSTLFAPWTEEDFLAVPKPSRKEAIE